MQENSIQSGYKQDMLKYKKQIEKYLEIKNKRNGYGKQYGSDSKRKIRL